MIRFLPLNTLVYVITLVVALGLALIIWHRNRYKSTNWLILAYISAIFAWVLGNFFADAFLDIHLVLWATRFSLFGSTLFLVAMIYIAYLFPDGTRLSLIQKALIWLPAGLQLVLMFTPVFIQEVSIENWGGNFTPGALYSVYALFLLWAIGLSGVVLIRRQRRATLRLRIQLRLIFFGTLITVLTGIFFSIIMPILGYAQLAILSPSSTLILFAFIVVAMAKHKLLDINAFIFRGITFSLLQLVLLVIFALPLLHELSEDHNPMELSTNLVIFILLVNLYSPAKRLIEKATRRWLFHQSYNTDQILERLSDDVKSTLSLVRLVKAVGSEVNQTLQLNNSSIVLSTESRKLAYYASGNSEYQFKLTYQQFQRLIRECKQEVLVFDDMDESPIKEYLRGCDIGAVVPLVVKEHTLGLWLLGTKATGQPFSPQDIELVDLFGGPLAVAIHNAHSYQTIQRFNVTLKEQIAFATQNLKKTNRRLIELNKLKSDFFSMATHELKNPVVALKGYMNLLETGAYGEIPQAWKEPLSNMSQGIDSLVRLTKDILESVRGEAGNITITLEKLSVKEITNTVYEHIKPLVMQKGLSFSNDCDSKFLVNADRKMLEGIINNLITNAIKYSDKGQIQVSCKQVNQLVEISVRDQGYGIGPDDAKKLFTRFFRTSQSQNSNIPGTGLGLFIVKQWVEKMGGTINVISEVGKGSTFTFTLPLGK